MNTNKKSILSSVLKVLTCTVVFTLCLAVVSFADKPEYDYTNAEALLKKLGILSEDFNPGATVKRDEFAGYTVKLIGLGDYKTDKEIPFTDVAVNDAHYSAIAAAYGCGIINGNSTNTFAPFDDVTIAQACKMLSVVTGYSPIADANGGFSSGYVTTAKRAGLLDNINTTEETITGETLVALLYNALTTDVFEPVSFGSDMTGYGLVEGRNLLLQTFGISYGEGIVTSNCYTSLTGVGTDDAAVVVINENLSFRTDADVSGLLGYDTYYFYKEKSVSPLIVGIFKKSLNSSVKVADEKFISFENDFLTYEDEKGNEKKKKTDPNFDVIYNGMANTVWTKSDFKVTNGCFEFVDNDSDFDIDVVFIESYTDYVVKSVSSATETIGLDFGKGSISFGDNTYINKLTDNGTLVEYTALVKGDVISVGESKPNGGMRVRIFKVSHTGFSGTVTEIGADEVTVNQKQYPYINCPGQLDMYMGLSGMFFVNADGRIIACDAGDRYLYAYVRGVKMIGKLDAVPTVQLLCSAGNKVEYRLSENAKADGLPSLTSSEILSRIKVGEVVRYRLNSNGEIISIDTTGEGSHNEDDRLTFDGEKTNLKYKREARTFMDEERLVSSETAIFFVPVDGNEKEYMMTNINQLTYDQRYSISFYDTSEMLVAGAAVIKVDSLLNVPSDTETLCIITGIGEKLLADGETVVCLNVYKSGLQIREYWISADDTDVYSGLKVGDVVQFNVSTSESGRVIAARVLHSSSANTAYYKTDKIGQTQDTALTVTWGAVEAVDDQTLLLNVDSKDPGVFQPFYLKSGLSFYVYDTGNNTVHLGTANDINIGDKVFLRGSYYAVQEGVIIR